jgi:hypothetical protein
MSEEKKILQGCQKKRLPEGSLKFISFAKNMSEGSYHRYHQKEPFEHQALYTEEFCLAGS